MLGMAMMVAFMSIKIFGIGIGVGKLLAFVMSLARNGSIGWAIIHLFCGWFYVIYWLVTGGKKKV